jgi:serine/threonine protein kinase
VRFIGAHNDGKFYNLFLELISGGTLEDLFKKQGGLSEPVVAVYTKQIL